MSATVAPTLKMPKVNRRPDFLFCPKHNLSYSIKRTYRPRESDPIGGGSRCPLDVKTAMQLHEEESKTDSIMDRLVDDPEFKELLVSKLKAMAT